LTHPVVIAGLDPAIHHFGTEIVFTMDARVKPAHDESGFVKLGISYCALRARQKDALDQNQWPARRR